MYIYFITILFMLLHSDEQAIQYFSTVMSRNDKTKKLHDIIIGRTHTTLYLRWCETILRLTESKMATKDNQEDRNKERYTGVCSAIKVLQTVSRIDSSYLQI